MSTLRRIRDLLHASSPTLDRLLQQTSHVERLNRLLTGALTDGLAAHCRIVKATAQQLILQVDSPGWASRLRYQLEPLKQHLARVGNHPIDTIRIKVTPPMDLQLPSPKRRLSPLSAQAATALRQTAQTIPDAQLRGALLRLAGRAKT